MSLDSKTPLCNTEIVKILSNQNITCAIDGNKVLAEDIHGNVALVDLTGYTKKMLWNWLVYGQVGY